jgi:hypothetical protein
MDEQLPNTNVPEESKPSDPNQQLSNADLGGVVGGIAMHPIQPPTPPDPQSGPPGSSKTNSSENSSAM